MSAILKKLLAPILSLFGKNKKQTDFHMPQGLFREQQKQLRELRERNTRDPNIPQTDQDSIPFQRMFPDGICRVTDNYYTKTIQF